MRAGGVAWEFGIDALGVNAKETPADWWMAWIGFWIGPVTTRWVRLLKSRQRVPCRRPYVEALRIRSEDRPDFSHKVQEY